MQKGHNLRLNELLGGRSIRESEITEKSSEDREGTLGTDMRNLKDIDEGQKNIVMGGTSRAISKPLSYLDKVVLNPALQSIPPREELCLTCFS